MTTIESFDSRAFKATGASLRAMDLEVIQVNIGLICNLKCVHCHVAAGPRRTEQMSWETMRDVLLAAQQCRANLIDITGGAPEMNPHFRDFVRAIHALGIRVQVRTNLTILLEPGYEDLKVFFKEHNVSLVASLPCYLEQNVDAQRGSGVFRESIEAIRQLNALGYGVDCRLPLVLVYNPQGPTLPPSQDALQEDYARELWTQHGIRFTKLIAIANMPIGRFWSVLKVRRQDAAYMDLLEQSFNPDTLGGLMCRHQISVDWDGRLYDCDFNLALELPISETSPRHIADFNTGKLINRCIATGQHCYGCTAGQGSSCSGELSSVDSVRTKEVQA